MQNRLEGLRLAYRLQKIASIVARVCVFINCFSAGVGLATEQYGFFLFATVFMLFCWSRIGFHEGLAKKFKEEADKFQEVKDTFKR